MTQSIEMDSVQLYHSKSEDIKIDISAYFEGSRLVIDGYDIGKRVKEYWGDSDYEYVVKIPLEGVEFLCRHLQIGMGHQQALAKTYNTNFCYSEIRQLMTENNIECEGFTWT